MARPLVFPRWLLVLLGLVMVAIAGARAIPDPLLFRQLSAAEVQETTLGGDFRLFWAQGHLAAQGHPEQAYDANAIAAQAPIAAMGDLLTPRPSLYPPTTLLLFEPLGRFDFASAWLIYIWGSLAVLLLSVLYYCRRTPEYIGLALGYPALLLTLNFGQNSLILTSLYLLVATLIARHPLGAGAALALAAFKPHLGLLAPLVVLARRQYLVFFAATVCLGLAVAVSWVHFGEITWQAYANSLWQPVQRLLDFHRVSAAHMISTYAALRQLSVPLAPALAAQAVVSIIALVFLVRVCRHALDPQLPVAALLLAGLIIVPHAYIYDLSLTLVPFLVLLRHAQRHGWSVFDLVALPLLYVAPLLHQAFGPTLLTTPMPLFLFAALVLTAHQAQREDDHDA